MWKLKVPLQVKIFLQYLGTEMVLARDNLSKKGAENVSSEVMAGPSNHIFE
jgi:hypothetical protein